MSRWLVENTFNPHATINLFCFPYAGGSASAFKGWRERLPRSVNQFSVQLPGRDERFDEDFRRRVGAIVDELLPEIVPHLVGPYAFFGHSLGALLGFELIRRLRDHGHRQPEVFFPSGRHAPQLLHREPVIHHLPDREFIAEIRNYNGTPHTLLEHPELLELFLPRLRADFEVSETYVYQPALPLSCPILAFSGLDAGNEAPEDLRAWSEQTSGAFEAQFVDGDHFFVHSAEAQVVDAVARRLTSASA